MDYDVVNERISFLEQRLFLALVDHRLRWLIEGFINHTLLKWMPALRRVLDNDTVLLDSSLRLVVYDALDCLLLLNASC